MIPTRDPSASATQLDARIPETRQEASRGDSATVARSGDSPEGPSSSLAEREEEIDDAIEMTFPASDPPAWMSSGNRGAVPRATDSAPRQPA